MTDSVIATSGVCKRYKKLQALSAVAINVRRGDIYGLIGDNGAGKTTLLKAIAGHIWPDKGRISILSATDGGQLARARRQIGAMIEKVGAFPNLTVAQNIEYCRILKGIPDKTAVKKTIELVGLAEKANAKCCRLSTGMKQRLGLATALIGEPQILILDEPINGLDPEGIHELRLLLKRLNSEKNMTILLSSHILSELQQTATVFGFLSKGRLIEEIGIRELERECADYIELGLSDGEAFAALLDRMCPNEKYSVTPEGKIRIASPLLPAQEYSRLAAQNGIYVGQLERHSRSLEDYYIDLKEGEKNV